MEADIKIMVFGQETNGWEGKAGSSSPSELMHVYENFYLKGDCYKYGGQFWNGFKAITDLAKANNPNKSIEFLWNNILKLAGKMRKVHPGAKKLNYSKSFSQ